MASESTQSRGTDSRGPSSTGLGRFDALVCVSIAGASYALDVAIVREVVSIEKLLSIPQTPAPVVGAFVLRGATVALVDARILFGLSASAARPMAVVIAQGHRTLCGLTIDHVIGVVPFTPARFAPAVRGREAPQVAGFLNDDQHGSITVLDTTVLLRSIERLRF